MTAIEATNRGLADMPWAMLTTAPAVPDVEVEALQERPPDALVLDVREREEYAHGHVPGAINLPQADLASQLDEVPRDRPIFVICQSGARSMRSAQFLKQMGFDEVASVRGGTEAWRAAGHPVTEGNATGEQPRIAESEWAHAGLRS
jgi:rhodanese-related sulfurtransferase